MKIVITDINENWDAVDFCTAKIYVKTGPATIRGHSTQKSSPSNLLPDLEAKYCW